MKCLAALLFFVDIGVAVPEMEPHDAWYPDEFGWCTKTDIAELGECGKLEVRTPKIYRRNAK